MCQTETLKFGNSIESFIHLTKSDIFAYSVHIS